MSKGDRIRNGGRRATESEKAERRKSVPYRPGLRPRRHRDRSKYLVNGMLRSEARKRGLIA